MPINFSWLPGPHKAKKSPPAKAPMPNPRDFTTQVVGPKNTQYGTLQGIAAAHYGNASYWPRIFNANKAGQRRADGNQGMITNPNQLSPGWSLIIP